MRKNRLRELIAANELLLGVMIDFPSPRFVEFVGWMGFNWVLIDGEHDGVSAATCADLVMACDAVGIASVVRVPVNQPELILAYADTGVSGVIAPHVRSAEEAKRLVGALRYPPHGTRGAASGSRAANYGFTQTAKAYFQTVEHTVAMALMEDPEGYDDIEAIAAVPGLEVLCLGTGDLSVSLGIPGDKLHPEITGRVEKARVAAGRHGQVLNAAVGDKASLEWAKSIGSRMLLTSGAGIAAAGGRAFLDLARSVYGADPKP